jgi:hypothetical protein
MINPPVGNLDRYLVICTVADTAALEAAISKSITSPLYTAADAPIRTQTHTYTAYKAVQATPTLTQQHLDDLNAAIIAFPTAIIEKYNSKTQNTYPQVRLSDLGLTVDSGAI